MLLGNRPSAVLPLGDRERATRAAHVDRDDVVDAWPEIGEQQLRQILPHVVALALDDGPCGEGEDADGHRDEDGIRARMPDAHPR